VSFVRFRAPLHPFTKRRSPKNASGAKNPKLFDGAIGLKKVTQKLGMDDKFDATTVAIYFREENVTKKGSVFVGMGPERTGCHQHTYFRATMGENSTEGVVDKNKNFSIQEPLYYR
jgi:cholesterol oxidase